MTKELLERLPKQVKETIEEMKAELKRREQHFQTVFHSDDEGYLAQRDRQDAVKEVEEYRTAAYYYTNALRDAGVIEEWERGKLYVYIV